MSASLPSPFVSPVFTPFSPSADSDHQEADSEHQGSPHHHHRKRDRVKSFVKHLAHPFSPHPEHHHHPQEKGSPSNSVISLSPELLHTPVLRKRDSGTSVKSTMKNPPSPHSSSSPLPMPFPSSDVSKLGPDSDHSSLEVDRSNRHDPDSEHHDSPHHHRKRDRVKSFVKHLISPHPEHHPQETGSPQNSTTSLSSELAHSPSILRNRDSSTSVRRAAKNPPSPHSSATPLPTPFPSPEVSKLANHSSPEVDHSNHQEPDSEHHDSPHHHHRKRDRVKSFVKHLISPHPDHPQEAGSPPGSTISLSSELPRTPSILRKRDSGASVKSIVKNPPSPHSSSSPLPTPFPSPDVSKLGRSPNHSSHELDHDGSPTRKRERVKSFVNGIRRTSSHMFKKDKKDGDKKSALSALAAESLTAATPTLLRRFSHSKHQSAGSMTTTETDFSETYVEVKLGSDMGSIGEPIIEVPTPISPVVVRPFDISILPMEETKESAHTGAGPETASQQIETISKNVDPLQLPLPPSRSPSPTRIAEPIIPIQISTGRQELGSTPSEDPVHNNCEVSREEEAVRETVFPREGLMSLDGALAQIEKGSLGSAGLENPTSEDEDEPPTITVEPPSTDPVAITPYLTDPASETPVLMDPASTTLTSTVIDPISTTPSPKDIGPVPATPAPMDPISTSSASADPVPTSPALADPVSKVPPSSEISQLSQASGSHLAAATDDRDKAMRDLCIPVLIPPMMFWPISNMRLSYIFTPLLTWWLSKGVVNYPSLYS